MSSKLKTAIIVDDSLIFDGNTIDAINHTNPLEDTQNQLREGQISVSSTDTYVKHLEDAITGASGKIKVTKQDAGADESLEVDLDATGVTSGYTPVANGANSWSWAASGGGGASPVDITGTAGEALAERDYVYLNESSGTWFKVDIDATPILCGRVRGIVNASGGISSAATGSIRLIGEISGYAGLTAWQPVYASSTAGGITQTRPSPTSGGVQVAIIQIGIAISTTNIVVLPQQPAQYMKRDTLANNGTLTITHHADEMAHLRRAFAYIGSTETGIVAVEYADSNQDVDVRLRDRQPATYGADQTNTTQAPGSSSSASSFFSASYVPSRAFDDNDTTYWATANGTPSGWIEYNFNATRTIQQYSIKNYGTDLTTSPKNWTLEYYNGSSWVIVDTQNNVTAWGIDETKTFNVSTIVSAQRWRINVSEVNGSTLYVCIREIQMKEVATYDNGPDKLAQIFTLASETDVISVELFLKKVASPTGTGTVRIETLSGGNPTGTLVDANATGTFSEAALTTSYTEISVSLADSVTLSAGTYAIVLSTDRSASEVNWIEWGADGSAPSYAGGEMKSESSSTWSAESKDAIFSITSPGTTFIEPAVLGRWAGGTRDVAIRYDDGGGADGNTKTTCKNVIGASADVTLVVEIP